MRSFSGDSRRAMVPSKSPSELGSVPFAGFNSLSTWCAFIAAPICSRDLPKSGMMFCATAVFSASIQESTERSPSLSAFKPTRNHP